MQTNKTQVFLSPVALKTCTVFGLVLTGMFFLYGFSNGIFESPQAMADFIGAWGVLAPAFFVAVQAAQVVLPILPGAVGCLCGVLLFGPLWGFVYSYTGICAGSIAAFLLARAYGQPLVYAMGGKRLWDKYSPWLDRPAYTKFFALLIFLPVAPDDFLCYLSGLSRMKFKTYTAIILLAKPFGIALYSLLLTTAFNAFQGLV